MINMNDLMKIVKLILLTGNLKEEKPMSLLIIGKSGIGKTELITNFDKKTLCSRTDLSYQGILNILGKNKDIKHIIIPDFIKITQKKRSTSDNFISILNAGTEEGIGEIDIGNFHYDLRVKCGTEMKNRHIALITATTKASFSQHKKRWESFGFVQRMLVVSYDYNDDTIEKIMNSINERIYLSDKREKIILSNNLKINTDKKLFSQFNKKVFGNFRELKQLQTLAMANALDRRSKVVEQQDIDEIIRLSKYMNLNYTKI